jgi:nickel-dependent lactate racemase
VGPLAKNIYQAVMWMTSAEATNKEGGVIIVWWPGVGRVLAAKPLTTT